MTGLPKTSRVEAKIAKGKRGDTKARLRLERRYKKKRMTDAFKSYSIWLIIAAFGASFLPASALGQAGVPYKVNASDTNPVDDAASTNSPDQWDASNNKQGGSSSNESPVLASSSASSTSPYHSSGRPPSYFRQLWKEWRIATANNETTRAQGVLRTLVQQKIASGWPNIFSYGTVLARHSDRARQNNQIARALELSQAATQLAPNLAAPHLAHLKNQLANGSALIHLRHSLIALIKASYTEAPELNRRLGNAILLAFSVILLSFTLNSIVVVSRHFRALHHDLIHILLGQTSRWQTTIISVCMMIAPLVFQWGLLGAALWWMAVVGIYLTPRERLAGGFYCLLFVLLPGIAPQLAGHFYYDGSRSEASYYAARDLFSAPYANELRALPEPTPNEQLVVAMRETWSGNPDKALTILESQSGQGSLSGEFWVALGNARFRAGKKGEAIAAYNSALAASPTMVEAYFNLARAYYSITQHSSGAEAHARAVSLRHDLVSQFEARLPGYSDVIDPQMPFAATGGYQLWDLSNRPQIGDALWSTLGAPLNRRNASLLALATLILLIILGALRERVRIAGTCRRCGQASCGRCDQGLPSLNLCWECHRSFVETFGVDKHLRIRKQLQSHRYNARRSRLLWWTSMLAAGMGQLADGYSLRGNLLLISYLGGLISFMVAIGALPAPLNAGSDLTGIDVVLSLLFLVAVHGVAQLTRKGRVG